MFRNFKVFFLALAVLSVLESASARKFSGGRHSYPKSGGLSGGGSHGYPSSGGLSGNSHGYPSGGGMSGSGGHGYPSSGGGSHAYPSSGGGSHAYPSSSNSHGYPASTGLSGSGNHGSHGYPANKGPNTVSHTTNIHNHYHYSPPQRITYTPVHGGAPVSYPVYRGTPPTYVYQYKNSDSKYGTLLAGLALLNLGTLAGSVYANSRHSSYKPSPGEVCKFGIRKDNGDYQETKIDCQLITSFIFEEEAKAKSGATNSTVTTTTVTNVTVVNTTNTAAEATPVPLAPEPTPLYAVLPNGTYVPVNITINAPTVNNTASAPDNSSAGSVMTSSVTSVTTTNTTVTNALDVKGKPVEVTPGMKCYVIRNSPTSNMRRSVPCGLLQSYADQSIRKNSAQTSLPSITILCVALTAIVIY